MRPLNLLYHRVNQLTPDPWTLCVSPANFAEQLQVIKRLFPRPTVTFDDGYEDNLSGALPLLEACDVEAHFFVISGAIGRIAEMWWDALDFLFSDTASYEHEYRRFRLLLFEQQEEELDRMFAARNVSRQARPGRRMLTQDELALLSASPLAMIGGHTTTHPVLSQLSLPNQVDEIQNGKRQLEEIIGYHSNGFAYPNGTNADYTLDTINCVRRAGFAYAYSAFHHKNEDTFQMPRVMIRDWNGDEFERHLRAAAFLS